MEQSNEVLLQLIEAKTNLVQWVGMIVCICVVVGLFIKGYHNSKSGDDKDLKKHKIHTFYISGILVFIIIELVTGLCMGDSNHAEILSYVNFAATLSSLIMSVVAIIFTIVTSNRGDEQYKKIDNVSDKVAESLSKFSEKTAGLDLSIASFQSISDGLSQNINTIIQAITEIRENTKELKVQQEHPLGKGKTGKTDFMNEVPTDSLVQRIISLGSFSGNIALYACILSKEKGKAFSIKDITESPEDASYKFGYLIACGSVGIISGQITMESCHIQDCNPNMKSLVETMINRFIDGSSPEFKSVNKNSFEKVKSVFD